LKLNVDCRKTVLARSPKASTSETTKGSFYFIIDAIVERLSSAYAPRAHFLYPSITLADVYAALSYYYDHLAEIRQNIRDSETFAQELAAKTPSILERKLKERNAR
jgi:hypothetical protein